MPVVLLVSACPKGRSWDWVSREGGIQVEQDARVGPGVQGRSRSTSRRRDGATASHLEVQALRIVLSAIVAPSAVQGNDLVSKDVVACLELGRDLHGDREVPTAREGIRGPHTRGVTSLLDLGPLQVSSCLCSELAYRLR